MVVIDGISDDDKLFVAGALILDYGNNRIYTFQSEVIQLTPEAFKTLSYLAQRENIHQSFKKIYKAVWANGEGTNKRDEARKTLADIIKRINMVGSGFVWIDFVPKLGYAYRTR